MRGAASSFHQLLRVRELRQRQHENAVADAERSRKTCQAAAEWSRESHALAQEALRQQLMGDLDLERIAVGCSQVVLEGAGLKERERQLRQAELQLASRRQELVESRRHRRLAEKILGQHQQRLDKHRQRQEDARLDEIGAQYHERGRR